MKTQKVTIHTLRQMKQRGDKIAVLTAYDATFARLFDESGADVLLVGDSLGMVVQGHDTTLPVTLDEMAYHCRAVVRGVSRAHVVGAKCQSASAVVIWRFSSSGNGESFRHVRSPASTWPTGMRA